MNATERNSRRFGLGGSLIISNYLKVMRRNMVRKKGYTMINIVGLTTGITFALLLGVFIWTQLQVNKDLRDVERLYFLESKYTALGQELEWLVPAPLAQRAVEEYPGVFENYFRFRERSITVSNGDKHFRLNGAIGDSTLISMFGFQTEFGEGDHALDEPQSVAVTARTAILFFGTPDVVGQTLDIAIESGEKKVFVIKAVMKDQKKNSVTDFLNMDLQLFIPLANSRDFRLFDKMQWSDGIIAYLKLQPGVSAEQANSILKQIFLSEAPETVTADRTIGLNPLGTYYLESDNGTVRKLVLALALMAFFVVFLAIGNFINLTIASSFSRLKEIGLRKVIGGSTRQIHVQFLGESMAFALLSGVISLLLYELLRQTFDDVLGTRLISVYAFGVGLWICIGFGLLSVGFLSGSYPAFYLSTVNAIDSMKGKMGSVRSDIGIYRILILGQFMAAIFILIVGFAVSGQVRYFLSKNHGFNISTVLEIRSLPRIWTEVGLSRVEASREEFRKSPFVEQVSLSLGSPVGRLSMSSIKVAPPGTSIDEGVTASLSGADENFAEVYGIPVVAGKFLMEKGGTYQPFNLVINEKAQQELSLSVGDKVNLQSFGTTVFTIVGIVKDFNSENLQVPIGPVVFVHNRDNIAYRYLGFKLRPGDPLAAIRDIERTWSTLFPEDPLVYFFLDDKLRDMYRSEIQLGKASGIAAVLILIIAWMGVFGLVSLNLAGRSKEIGIRKVLGAGASKILVLFAKEYVILVLVASIIGIPTAYLFLAAWLRSYAHHAPLTSMNFLIPVACLLFLTIVIVAFRVLKAALESPVKSIRHE